MKREIKMLLEEISNMRKKKEAMLHSILLGALVAFISFTFLGSISAIIKNPFFTRMTPVHLYDYIFLSLTAMLLGIYMGLWYYTKNTSSKCSYLASGGTLGGFLSFGCALCNKLLLVLLGIAGVTAYFMPIQPLLGMVSISLLISAVHRQYKILRSATYDGK